MSLNKISSSELYPTESFGPSVLGTLIYKVGDQTEFKGAYITTNERIIMNVDMMGEEYRRVFSYADIIDVYINDKGLFIEFPDGMGKIVMVNIEDGDTNAFVTYVKDKLN
ncbi:hypothetical protein [Phocicoccus pinnipedialis]|uniref:YokE-like PH domain-containing protein n=1 Tax=Phocicoccus pinnipedialis TaxID=110845 RepID=A0A6V7R4Q0_9BACL|nr:hypothetical protein [Jeotgalicoccus pinnipedialis]MBP1939791.1 hypothetical protein [Jeotgalicoccus pinnipedialis]CAD2072419.1 hypothetical protein JEOPIN946_00512 [Jeotgalicoccus pinnipedialis]